MKSKLLRLENEARLLDGTPNERLQVIIEKNSSCLTPDAVDRLVEMYNVNTFLENKEAGLDLENDFDLADSNTLITSMLKNDLCKKAEEYSSYSSVEGFYDIDYNEKEPTYFSKEAEYIPDTFSSYHVTDDPCTYNDTFLDNTVYSLITKTASYCDEWNSSHKYNSKFVEELRYLYPDSYLLKNANLDKGKVSCPDSETGDHLEYKIASAIIEKLAAKGSSDSSKLDKTLNALGILSSPFISLNPNTVKKKVVPSSSNLKPYQTLTSKVLFDPIESAFKRRDEADKYYRQNIEANTQNFLKLMDKKEEFEDLITNDEILRDADKNLLLDHYKTLTNVAPTLSSHPAFVKNFLRGSLPYGDVGLDIVQLTKLIESEEKLKRLNYGNQNRAIMEFLKALKG